VEFNHVGIPTTEKKENEIYLDGAKLFVTDFNESEHKIEWLRFEDDSPMPDVLKTTAHVAYKVEDLDAALKDREVLIEPFSPVEGLKVAFTMEDGAPIEYMQEV